MKQHAFESWDLPNHRTPQKRPRISKIRGRAPLLAKKAKRSNGLTAMTTLKRVQRTATFSLQPPLRKMAWYRVLMDSLISQALATTSSQTAYTVSKFRMAMPHTCKARRTTAMLGLRSLSISQMPHMLGHRPNLPHMTSRPTSNALCHCKIMPRNRTMEQASIKSTGSNIIHNKHGLNHNFKCQFRILQ